MTPSVQIARIASYADGAAIRRFVDSALAMNDDIREFLANGDPNRLVVVKPNWVQESREDRPDAWEQVITHPAVLVALIEALAERMQGQGTVCVCDGPHTYASFDAIVARGGFRGAYEAIARRWPTLRLELLDLRREVWIRREEVVVERRANTPDPRGYVAVDLGRDSFLHGHCGEGRYYGADYDRGAVNSHHHGATQEYLLSGTAMQCGLFINVPKMKTHKKTGISCCLKNLVGVNGDKNWLPHHTEGTPSDGGDEFPSESLAHLAERMLKKAGQRVALALPIVGTWLFRKARNAGKWALGDSATVVRNGNWEGNDTCWRMALDLNRALLYAAPDGTLAAGARRKRYLAIVDGIVGGEGNGPLCPDPVDSGVMVAGTDPAAVDAVVARLMGFEPGKLPVVRHAFARHQWPIAQESMDQVRAVCDGGVSGTPLDGVAPAVAGGFRPHFGWPDVVDANRAKPATSGARPHSSGSAES